MPASYKYQPLRQDIICAETAIDALPAAVDALGGSRALITCGPTILNACDVVPRVREALGGALCGDLRRGGAPFAGGNGGGGRGCGAGGAAGHFGSAWAAGARTTPRRRWRRCWARAGTFTITRSYLSRRTGSACRPRRRPSCRLSACRRRWGAPSSVAGAGGLRITGWGGS